MQMKSICGSIINEVEDFKYLGSYIRSTKKYVNIRIDKAWATLNSMNTIWKSKLSTHLKRQFVRAAVKCVLVYGSVTWTLTASLEKKIYGTYTRMLRAVTNKSWRDHLTNEQLYGNISKISKSIRMQRLRFAGHCWRSKYIVASDLILWQPQNGNRSRGRPAKTYIDQLRDDTDLLTTDEIKTAMNDREVWNKYVMDYRASSTW